MTSSQWFLTCTSNTVVRFLDLVFILPATTHLKVIMTSLSFYIKIDQEVQNHFDPSIIRVLPVPMNNAIAVVFNHGCRYNYVDTFLKCDAMPSPMTN